MLTSRGIGSSTSIISLPVPGNADADLDLVKFEVEYDAEAVIDVVQYLPFAAEEEEGSSSSSMRSLYDLRAAWRDERVILRDVPGLGREGGGGGGDEDEEQGLLLLRWMRRCLGFDGSAVGEGERRFREGIVVVIVVGVALPLPFILATGRGVAVAFVATVVVFAGTVLTTLVIFTLVAMLLDTTGFPLKNDEALELTVDTVEVLVATDIILDEPDAREDEADDNVEVDEVEDDKSDRGDALP